MCLFFFFFFLYDFVHYYILPIWFTSQQVAHINSARRWLTFFTTVSLIKIRQFVRQFVPKNNEKFYNSFELRHTVCAGPLPGLDFQCFRFLLYLLQLFYLIKTIAKGEMTIHFMERLNTFAYLRIFARTLPIKRWNLISYNEAVQLEPVHH